jgi:hypothetical protein
MPINAGVGLVLENRVSHNMVWFGVFKDAGGALHLGYRVRLDGSIDATPSSLAAPPGAGAVWLRMRAVPDPVAPKIVLSYSTTGAFAGFTDVEIPSDVANRVFTWAGFLGLGRDATPLAGAVDVTLDDFVSFCPFGELPFYWYVFRDPTLLGEPDLIGAYNVLQSLKPAHTFAAMITSKHLIVGDPLIGIVGRGPL